MKDKMHPPSESTSQFIRKYLTEKGKSYPWKMYRLWCFHLKRLGMKSPKFDSFRKYIWVLTKLGLIRRTKSPPYKPLSPILRVYYELVPKTLVPKSVDVDKAWKNPQRALFGEKMRLGRRRYRRRILKKPALVPGRPKGSRSSHEASQAHEGERLG